MVNMTTMILFIYGIAYGLNIIALVRVYTNTWTMPEKCSLVHPVKENGTFEAYCKGEWDFTRMRASQLIAAAGVVKNVNNCLQIPSNEAQARPLAQLPPEKQVEVWDE